MICSNSSSSSSSKSDSNNNSRTIQLHFLGHKYVHGIWIKPSRRRRRNRNLNRIQLFVKNVWISCSTFYFLCSPETRFCFYQRDDLNFDHRALCQRANFTFYNSTHANVSIKMHGHNLWLSIANFDDAGHVHF